MKISCYFIIGRNFNPFIVTILGAMMNLKSCVVSFFLLSQRNLLKLQSSWNIPSFPACHEQVGELLIWPKTMFGVPLEIHHSMPQSVAHIHSSLETAHLYIHKSIRCANLAFEAVQFW